MDTVASSEHMASAFEIDGLLRAQSPVKDKKPALERHISHIPKDDEQDNAAAERPRSGHGSKEKFENMLKKSVSHDYENEQPISAPQKKNPGPGPALEVTGLMRMDSNEDEDDQQSSKPSLLRKITKSSEHEEQPRKPTSRLERTISSIPQDDYDSDGERPT